MYGNRLANTRVALLAEITRARYEGAGILEHKSRMDSLHMKLTEAGNPIPNSLYLNFFVNSLPEEFDVLVNMVNYDLDTVEEVVSNIRQMEIKKSLHTEHKGTAFATQKRAHVVRTPRNVQGATENSERRSKTRSGGCFNCREHGHWARNCPKRKRGFSTHQDRKKVKMNPDRDSKDPPGKAPTTVRGLFSAIEMSLFFHKNEISHRCYIDSGTSGHFVPHIEYLHDFLPFPAPKTITTTSGAQVQSKGAGTMKIKVKNGKSEFIGQIPHVQWVPDIYTCLLAPTQLIKDRFCINLHESSCTILDSNNRQLTSVHEVGNIYPVDLAIVQSSTAMSTGLELTPEDLQE